MVSCCFIMSEENLSITIISQIFKLLDSSWVKGILEKTWTLIKGYFKRPRNQGMYEVIDYQTTLDLIDSVGESAKVYKLEKVRYLQDNIIAFQDQAWGDGKILVNYQCYPGMPVDRYRWGYKHHVLISLRQVKSRGDIDDFKISWEIIRGFLSTTGFWGTEISHNTKHMAIHIIFPLKRPPKSAWILEKNRQKTFKLGAGAIRTLRGGNQEIFWEKKAPRLFEQYILKWEW